MIAALFEYIRVRLFVQGVFLAEGFHLCLDFFFGIFKISGDLVNALGDDFHILFFKTAGGDGGSADTDTAGDEGTLGIVGDGVFVGGDVHFVQFMLHLLAGDVEVSKVDEHQMIVGAAGNQIKSAGNQSFG